MKKTLPTPLLFSARRLNRLLTSLGILSLMCVAAGCSNKPKPVSADTWATVDGRSIMRDDVEKAFRRTQDAAATLSPEEAMTVKLSLLNEMILQDILVAKARALKVDVTDSELNAAYAERKKNLTDAAFEEELKKRNLSSADMWQTQTSLLPSSARMRRRVLSASALNTVSRSSMAARLLAAVDRFIYSP